MSLTKKNLNGIILKVSISLDRFGIKAGEKLLIGFSGGPDSTFLMTSLNLLKKDWNFELFAAYIDHGIRKRDELEDEINFIETYSKQLGIPFYVEHIPEGEIQRAAKEKGISCEEYARGERYSLLYKLANRVKASRIVFGHTYDDQLETIIMRFFKGSDYTGLSGIPERRGKIIRPLISIKKNDITGYLKKYNISYRTDSTNLENDYLRNRVRHILIPGIREVFPGYESALNNFASKMQELKTFTEGEILNNCNYTRIKQGYKINGHWFLYLPGFLRVQLIYYLFNSIMKNNEKLIEKIPYNFLSVLLNRKKMQRRKILLKGYGFKLYWKDDELFYERDVVSTGKKGYLIKIEKNVHFNIDFLHINITLSEDIDGYAQDGILQVESKGIKEPVVLRSWREGDRIGVKGGKKLVKKVFQELKVPENERENIPLLVDREGIKIILGKPLGFANVCSYGIMVKREEVKKLNIIIKITEK